MTDALKIKVIVGTTRPGRFSEKPARWIYELLKKKDGVEAELLDLRDYPMPFFNEPVSPSMSKEPYTDKAVAAWTAKIAEADGFVMIAAEYNHGYAAVLKNALDYVGSEWHDKAVGFVSYGGATGARAVEQLREVVVELQMAPIHHAVQMPFDVIMASFKGTPENELFTAYDERGNGMLDQLITWSKALKGMREQAK
jgi:NAD(P)H-dependent FMN reductase